MNACPTAATDRSGRPGFWANGRWRTPESVARFKALYAAGMTDTQIAARLPDLFDTPLAVSCFRRRRKLPANGDPVGPGRDYRGRLTPTSAARLYALHSAGLTAAQIAEAMPDVFPGGWAHAQVTLRGRGLKSNPDLTKPNRRYRPLHARIHELYAAGLSNRQIADRVPGLTPEVVSGILNHQGLPSNRLRHDAELIARYGLPPGVGPVGLLLLIALTAGPLNSAELRAVTGRRNNFVSLIRKGLIARVTTRGRHRYLLTARAMDLMTGERRTHP